MMPRRLVALAVIAALALCGCSTPKGPNLVTNDPIDALLAKSAMAATEALRELSESSGTSRVVVSKASPATGAPAVASPAVAPPAPRQSIAAKRAIIAVDEIVPKAPVPDVNVTPAVISTGVVASGGLLSAPPPGLERLITVRWTGELEQVLSRIAAETGWSLAESKGLRVAPVIVSVNAENRSAFDLLRDIGAIAGAAAEIRVSSASRTFTVQYPQR